MTAPEPSEQLFVGQYHTATTEHRGIRSKKATLEKICDPREEGDPVSNPQFPAELQLGVEPLLFQHLAEQLL